VASAFASLVPRAARTPRLARSTRIAVAVAGALLVGTTGAALALDSTSRDRTPAAPPPSPAAAAPICDDSVTAGDPVTTDLAARPYALPPGWVWHRDPAGFEVAVPRGWTRESDGDVACFRDPGGSRTLEVQADGPRVALPLDHWRTVERAALADGELPDYRLIRMSALDVKDGGADWEYTWQPRPGVRQHERRVLLSTAPERSYVLGWTTQDQDWAADEPLLQLIIASLS
jgi:hypothetical protein